MVFEDEVDAIVTYVTHNRALVVEMDVLSEYFNAL